MQNNKRKIVVFDFDGVVCDSTDECMVTSWNAWQKWNERPGFRSDLNEFSETERLVFRKLRPYVRSAGEYYILRRRIEECLDITSQKLFDQLRDRWLNNLEQFKTIFFEAREKLRRKDLESWIDLHPVFEDVINVMKILNKEKRLYIATLKDGKSVRLIIENQGLFISPDHLLDQAKISTKLEALDRFLDKENANKDDLIFIDDNVTHLLKPKKAGYSILLSGWGPSLKEHRQYADKERIPVIMNISEGKL